MIFPGRSRQHNPPVSLSISSEHRLVLDALPARDSEGASAAMLTHLRTVERNRPGGSHADDRAPSRHCERMSLYSACSGSGRGRR
ncbi:FCD domain-containing protein [Mesorhizobium sp.]|uniref:FCD domain-containing protein n=1 Tax=Mesorhizobium sp. TaxID=1871066 RepID=UPI00345761B4